MSVTARNDVETQGVGVFVPFRGFDRSGIVGTLMVNAEGTGDSSGGNMDIFIDMKKESFGFRPIWVPTRIETQDNLSSPVVVRVGYSSGGTERLLTNMNEVVLPVAFAGVNSANYSYMGIAIEPDVVAGDVVLYARWGTNTNSVEYHLHVYGVLYDAQAMAAQNPTGRHPDQLLAGIR